MKRSIFFSFISFQSLVLAKNSTAYKYFINPPLNPQLRVHIFNYTNAERFLEGKDKKLKVKDVGPYVYTERTEKVDVVYHDNNTISYRVSIVLVLIKGFINYTKYKRNSIYYAWNKCI